jgi:hypothetical protein
MPSSSSKKSRGGGSAKWTTPEQLIYLEDKKSDYHAAQLSGGKRFSNFWVSVFEGYFAEWPLPELTEEEKAAGMTNTVSANALKAVSG